MTLEEAIKILSELHDQCCQADSIFCTDTTGARCEAVDMAISALEKQIPKKPIIKIDVFNENLWHLYCPTCGTWVGMHNKRLKQTDMHNNTNSEICAKCGQMFDLELGDNR